ncbi:hypothetical protein D3C87_2128620 [compost metagenome]
MTNDEVVEVRPEASLENVRELINAHPLISPIEIKEAFSLRSLEEVNHLIEPLLSKGEVYIQEVPHGWFIRKV